MRKYVQGLVFTAALVSVLSTGTMVLADNAPFSTCSFPTISVEKTIANDNIKIGLSNPFKKLLEDGVISEETYTKIENYLKATIDEKIANVTYNSAKNGDKKQIHLVKADSINSLLDDMLNSSVITQSEYDTIKISLDELQESHKDFTKGATIEFKANMATRFQKFVDNGTINQATHSAIIKFYDDKMTAAKVAATDGKVVKIALGDDFEELVINGIITQNQADAMKSSIQRTTDQFKGK